MFKFTIKNLLVLVAFVALVVALFVVQRDLAQKSSELSKLQQEFGLGGEYKFVQVVLKTEWAKSSYDLALSSTSSQRKFTESYSSSEWKTDSPGLSFSVCYVGKVDLKNGFELGNYKGNGHLIAVKISFYDHGLGETIETTTKYILYEGREIIAYQNGKSSITIRPPEQSR